MISITCSVGAFRRFGARFSELPVKHLSLGVAKPPRRGGSVSRDPSPGDAPAIPRPAPTQPPTAPPPQSPRALSRPPPDTFPPTTQKSQPPPPLPNTS